MMKTDSNFYDYLSYEEKQLCDLCRDWCLGECSKCEFVRKHEMKNIGRKRMVILYTTHCPNCKRLTEKLKEHNIKYVEVDDVDIMVKKGYTEVPMLEVDDISMNFKTAVEWINNL